MSKRKGPKTKGSGVGARWQSIAEGVIRPNSPARQEYDRRGFQPPISEVQQGRPAIAVAGHI